MRGRDNQPRPAQPRFFNSLLALDDAKRRGHGFLTPEHLLLAVTRDERSRDVLRACGADLERVKQKVEKYLAENAELRADDETTRPQQTIGVERVLQRAAIHAHSAEQKVIDGGDVLVALCREVDSFAMSVLRDERIQQRDILDFVSRGIAKEEQGEPAALAIIEKMPEPQRNIGQRLHALILRSAPHLQPGARSGTPSYSNDGKWVCFFNAGTKYVTFGLSEEASLAQREGPAHHLLESAWLVTEFDEASESKLAEIIRIAAS